MFSVSIPSQQALDFRPILPWELLHDTPAEMIHVFIFLFSVSLLAHNTATQSAQIAQAAYEDSSEISHENIIFGNRLIAFYDQEKNSIYIGVRGSAKIQNWISNAHIGSALFKHEMVSSSNSRVNGWTQTVSQFLSAKRRHYYSPAALARGKTSSPAIRAPKARQSSAISEAFEENWSRILTQLDSRIRDSCMSSKPVDFQHAIEAIKLDVLTANTEGFRQELPKLFNLFEGMAAEIMALRLENQKLRDENNRLKGEQGKPNIRPQTKNKDISSEVERRKIHNKLKKVRKSKAKKHKIKIDHQKRLSINKRNLPADAVFKGWESGV